MPEPAPSPSPGTRDAPRLSVVIPAKNEAQNIAGLIEEIAAAFATGQAYEIIVVDDGSTDGTLDEIKRLKPAHPPLRCLRHDRSCGQSSAIRTGVLAARGDFIATLDGDGQNDPADLPKMIEQLEAARADNVAIVAGQRIRRQDRWHKRAASKIANTVRQALLNDRTDDAGCGIRVYCRDAYLRLPYFDHMHRFMTALFIREGFDVAFAPVNHRPRRFGRSNYGVFDRLWVSISDMVGVMWLRRRCRLPNSVERLD